MKVDVLIAGTRIDGAGFDGARFDVALAGGRIVAIGRGLVVDAGERIEAGDGGLIPGLHDHHIHLMAAAAARASVDLLELGVTNRDQLVRTLRLAASALVPGEWLRVIGYHESIAGDLDADVLDSMVPDRPARVQHRTGIQWVLNTPALREAGLESGDGIIRRSDDWLRSVVPASAPDLRSLARSLRAFGITGITDATPVADLAAVHLLDPARALLDVVQCTAPALTATSAPEGVTFGPVKLLFDDDDFPDFDEVVSDIANAHRHGRAVAFHAVTRAGLAFAVAALDGAGAVDGDRIEHGAVVPPDLRDRLAAMRVRVVTQPAFIARRGDDYLRDVDPDDVPWLWPCRSLLDAGVRVAAGSDAPYGTVDPWKAIAAAADRCTPSGAVLGADEVVSAGRALAMYLGSPDDPGGSPRTVTVGAPADLCLLAGPLRDVLRDPSSGWVLRTWSRHDR